MIKTITTALALTVASCSMSPAYANSSPEFCAGLSNIAMKVASLRDTGMAAGDVYEVLVASGLPEEAAYNLVLTIYTTASDDSPEVVGKVFYKVCAGEAL